jgi:hypothetical protein
MHFFGILTIISFVISTIYTVLFYLNEPFIQIFDLTNVLWYAYCIMKDLLFLFMGVSMVLFLIIGYPYASSFH